VIKGLLKNLIKAYQGVKKVFPTRRVCVFYPTCSDYALQAIEHYGVWRGITKALYRIARCHPWQKQHFDPIQ
jgi:hypothetical protein